MIDIPLRGGLTNAKQSFVVQLGDNLVEFDLSWNPKAETWRCNIIVNGEAFLNGATLTAGSVVNRHKQSIGTLYFWGDDATLDNLGQSNTLSWSNV